MQTHLHWPFARVATYCLSNSVPEDMKEMLPVPEENAKRLKVLTLPL